MQRISLLSRFHPFLNETDLQLPPLNGALYTVLSFSSCVELLRNSASVCFFARDSDAGNYSLLDLLNILQTSFFDGNWFLTEYC